MRDHSPPDPTPPAPSDETTPDEFGVDTVATTAADVESAGRSCMAILVLGIVIVLLLCVWIGFRSVGGGQ